ncbi:MAG: rhomboid family intramembrane serine protease [Gammaproteobacteria bacterium]|nr:rhomboid family intramembrane serine protease [Gammaproteobacteria bacterium]
MSVHRAPTRSPCHELALVLGAMGIEHRVSEQPDGCHLLVPEREAATASEQLRLYRRENPRDLRPAWPRLPPGRGAPGALLYTLVLALAFAAQASYLFDIDWTRAGGLVAGEVQRGAWWLAVTALTLHADAAHVAGNMVFGSFFGYLAGQYLGSGVAWLTIATTGAAGNVLNAWLQAPDHRSIGASTAVFAALGLVAACVWTATRGFALGWARRWSPVVSAVALLAYTGTGDEQTDIVAHLTGFLAGGAGGLLLQRWPGRMAGRVVQTAAGVLAALVVVLAWGRALAVVAG